MQSVYNYFNRKTSCNLPFTANNSSLKMSLNSYRKWFLMRKNINGYKKNIRGTPVCIDKILNAFDRKINKISLLSEENKIEYLKGIHIIYSHYYGLCFEPKISKKQVYNMYFANCYCHTKVTPMAFIDFIKSHEFKLIKQDIYK